MKITDLKVWVTKPEPRGRSFVFLQIETDEGIYGIGEATSSGGGGSIIVGNMARFLRDSTVAQDFRESLIGENPEDIDRLWHKLFRRFTGGGGYGGFVSTLLSGIDIALWDIKGKAMGKPVFRLFGGPVWDEVLLYTHVRPGKPEEAAAHAKSLVAEGYTALKTDPFSPEMGRLHRRYMRGAISPAGANNGVETIAAMREAIGPDIEILIDCHGNFNVPTAIKLARRLEPYDIGWYEEPVQPDSVEALKHVKESVNLPICVGERLYTRFDFVPILQERLAEYIMPDILWTGGISEMRKIANMAEAYYIPISPHDASGPINVLSGAHTMMTVPNFYRLEFNRANLDLHNAFVHPPLDIRDGYLHLSERPGLGVELDVEYIEAHPDPDWK
ncbi:MAG: mandelate racemase/muconate lactonizing enzyme family protein [Chloroflexi bacterium]|nr:mandelate racemase/muconate lactonizing enzyme family protein [Chloroflexota bacterium]